jgi:hypothetical protein
MQIVRLPVVVPYAGWSKRETSSKAWHEARFAHDLHRDCTRVTVEDFGKSSLASRYIASGLASTDCDFNTSR